MKTCALCLAADGIESHHVAGRRNDPGLVIDLCQPCHDFQTRGHNAAGVFLEEGERGLLDRYRATVVGLFLIRELRFSLIRDQREKARQARVVGRLLSMILDLVGDPERPGRWTPDPTVVRPPTWPRRFTPDQLAVMEAAYDAEIDRLIGESTAIAEAHAWWDEHFDVLKPRMLVAVFVLCVAWSRGRRRERAREMVAV